MSVRSFFRWLLGAVLLVPVVLIALLAGVVYSEGGSRWAVNFALERSGQAIRIGQVTGRLRDVLVLHDVAFDTPGATGTLERLALGWQPEALFAREVLIDAIDIDGLDLALVPQAETTRTPPPVEVPAAPLPITIRRIALNRLGIGTGGKRIEIDRLLLGAQWDADAVRLSGFEIEAYGHRLAANGSVDVGDRPVIAASADWRGDLGGESGAASFQLSGPLRELRFESSLDARVSAELSGEIDPLADVPTLALRGEIQPPPLGDDLKLAVTHFNVEGNLESLNASIETDLESPQTGIYALTLDTKLALPQIDDDAITARIAWRAEPRRDGFSPLAGSGKIRFGDDRLAITHSTDAPYRSELAGDIGLGGDAPVLDLALTWSDIHYRVDDAREFIAREGDMKLTGPVRDLVVSGKSQFEVPDVGPVAFDTNARVKGDTLSIDTVAARLLDGTISATGSLDWSSALRGDFDVNGKDINLGGIRPDTPSRLGFTARGNFENGANGLQATVDVQRLDGYLRGQRLTGEALAHVRGADYVLERARLVAGDNAATARGRWSKRLEGEFDLKMRDLGVFDSRLAGSFDGAGTIAGEPARPRVDARLSGRSLRFEGLQIADLDALIKADLATSDRSEADIDVTGLEYDGAAYGRLSVRAQGNPEAHTLEVDLDGPVVTVHAQSQGTLADATWRGILNALEVDSERTGAWALEVPAALSIDAETMSLGESCLASAPARLCVAATRNAESSQAQVQLHAIPLGLSDDYLPATVKLRGEVDGSTDLNLTGGVVGGTGSLRVSDGFVERRTGDGEPEKIAIEAFAIDFNLLPATIAAQIDATVSRWFTLRGKVDAGRTEGTPIDASFVARSDDISWLAEFVPEIAGTRGGFDLNANVGGSVEAPAARGQLRLVDGAIEVPDAGLVIERVESTFSGDARALKFTADIGAGAGKLDIRGAASSDDGKRWRYEAAIDGKDFPLVRIPEAEADITPALALKGDPDGLDVSGTLDVPRVRIDVKRLPTSAVSVSDDEIIIAADGSEPDSPARRSFLTDHVSGRVSVRLGDDISISGFGLESSLSGGVEWVKKRGSALGTANGVILIDRGVYKAYGQNMQIDNGRIRFAGPVDNPALNLRAYRPDLDVKAGVAVTGSMRSPKISLFSEPALSDGNTLSYIVTGRGLDDAGAGDASLLAQAALSLGAEESAVVTNQIRNTFGLDEFSVNTGNSVQESSLVAGKRLSPKLSVRTDFNPFDQLWTFFLNYKLTPRWSVEAESGERQGADLLYSIERESLFEGFGVFD